MLEAHKVLIWRVEEAYCTAEDEEELLSDPELLKEFVEANTALDEALTPKEIRSYMQEPEDAYEYARTLWDHMKANQVVH